jgi:hypothetical protein
MEKFVWDTLLDYGLGFWHFSKNVERLVMKGINTPLG